MMRFDFGSRTAKTIISAALLGVLTFSVTAQAAGEVTLSSKGTLTIDGTNVEIHSSDIYSLKSAYEENKASLTNMNSAVTAYKGKAATTNANLAKINTGVDKARLELSRGLKNMSVQYDTNTKTFYAANSPTDWPNQTAGTISATDHGQSLESLISLLSTETGRASISMNGTGTTATATPGAASVPNTATKIKKTDTAGIVLSGANASNLYLDSGAKVTLPAGYYNSPITVQNGGANLTATYTFPANSTGTTVDLGSEHNYRYVNATNVYAKGKADGVTAGYNQGVTDADARANSSSYNYQAGYSAGKAAATIIQSRLATPSGYSKYETAYTYSYTCPKAGVISCYSTNEFGGTGYITRNGSTQASGQTFAVSFMVNAGDSIYYSHNYGNLSGWIDYAYIN